MTEQDKQNALPISEEIARFVLAILSPTSVFTAIAPLSGSFSNTTSLVIARTPDDNEIKIVVRRYAVFYHYDRGEKARREFRLFQLLYQSSISVPEPLLLDDTGTLLGSPGIITRYVPGTLDLNPTDPLAWAREIAQTLARIHLIDLATFDGSFLLNGHDEALWFLKDPTTMPDYIQAHPKGSEVWTALQHLLPTLQPVPSSIVHIDYWPGQLLWADGQIVAVVDWEEVAYGDPAIDVAYCRMNLVLSGQMAAATTFLEVYEQEIGRQVANLGFWELAAAVRPMFAPEGWITESSSRELFIQFVDDALHRSRT